MINPNGMDVENANEILERLLKGIVAVQIYNVVCIVCSSLQDLF